MEVLDKLIRCIVQVDLRIITSEEEGLNRTMFVCCRCQLLLQRMSRSILASIPINLEFMCILLSPPHCYPLLTVIPSSLLSLLTVIPSSLLSPPHCYPLLTVIPSSLLSHPHCYLLLTVIPSSLLSLHTRIHAHTNTHAYQHTRASTHTRIPTYMCIHTYTCQFGSLHSTPYMRFSVQNVVNWSYHILLEILTVLHLCPCETTLPIPDTHVHRQFVFCVQ